MSPAPTNSGVQLRVSAYERVSSWLVSLLVMTSVVVGSLLSIYFARTLATVSVAVPVKPVTLSGGGGGGEGGQLGAGGEIALPEYAGSEELSDSQLDDTLDTIASAVTQTEPLLFGDTIDVVSDSSPTQDYIDTRRPGTTGSGSKSAAPPVT